MIAKVSEPENPLIAVDGYDPAAPPTPRSPAIVRSGQLDLFPSDRGRWYSTAKREVLRRYIAHLAAKPYCAEDLDREGTLIRPAGRALAYPLVQYNTPWRRWWLWVDVDRPLDMATRFPVSPSLVLVNPENGHYHVAWELAEPVHTHEGARLGPQRWADAIERRLVAVLGGDSGHVGLLGKNPLHGDWRVARVGRGSYDLATFESALADAEAPASDRPIEAPTEGRNCALFEMLRHRAYRLKARCGDYGEFWEAVAAEAATINGTFGPEAGGPVPPREVAATVKSVATWTWHRYTGTGRSDAERKRDERRRAGAAPRDHYLTQAGDRRAQALLLAADGLSIRHIADRLGVGKSQVHRYLQGG